MKHLKLMSMWLLLMMFTLSSYASVPLTRDMWQGGGDCAYNLNVSTEEIYGLGTPDNTKYADLSGYSKLILTVSNGQPRLFFNTKTYNGDRLTVGPNAGQYMTVNGNTYTVDLNAIWFDEGKALLNSIKGGGWGTPATITSMELVPYEGTPVKWNIDNGITIDGKSVKDKFNDDDPIVVPVRNSDLSTWSVSPRFKVRNADTDQVLQVGTLCNNNAVGNYFKVIYSVDGILQNNSIDTNTTGTGEVYPRINGLTALKYGEVSMTVIYKGNGTYNPYSKTYNFIVEGLPLQFAEYNPTWEQSYEKYLDESQYRLFFKLQSSGSDVNYNTSIPCTVTAVNDLGEPIVAKIMKLDQYRYYDASRLDIYLTPNTLGTQTFKLEYPGDNIYTPATYFFDVTVKQHMVDLRWVDSQGNETDEWRTSYGNGYNGIPMLKMYVDNVEVNLSDWASRLQFSSSQPNIASMKTNWQNPTNSNQYVDFHAGGLTVIEARFLNQSRTVDNINYYYYNDEAASYTMILTYGSSGAQPRIVWISASRYDWTSTTGSYGSNARGSYLGQKWIDAHHTNPDWLTDDLSQYTQAAKPNDYYPFQGNFTHYGNNVFVSAVALKSSVTDADLASAHIFPIPGYANHYYVRDDADNQWWVNAPIYGGGTWRVFSDIPEDYLFKPANFEQDYPGDNFKYQNFINYMVDKPAMLRDSKIIKGTGQNFNEGQNTSPQSVYKFIPAFASQDSLKVYAYIEGYDVFSTTKLMVAPGELQLRFVPDYGTVNAGYSISPYVNCPDLRMEDVNKIWLTVDCPTILNVPNNGVVYETGVTSQADIAKYLFTVAANDTIWVNPDDHRYGIQEIRPTVWLRGINPEIFGLATGIGDSCTVTLHLTSDMYNEATATYKLTVVGNNGDKPMFHWAVNHQKQGDNCIDDGIMKKISVAEGDFIYMPGICGNSNGNKDYSNENTFKYLYAITNGTITMNRAKYFPGEGVPNYFLTNSVGGNPMIPQSGDHLNSSQSAIITWSHGEGYNWRKDSLMIYGNKEGVMYLYAQDPQTGKKCTPIQITVVPRNTMVQAKRNELAGMTYPFTWDFEHMDMTKYVADVENNSGTYWQKKFVEEDKEDNQQGLKRYNRNYSVEKPLYQYNGGMNADWDDKDNNGTSRQRWFKDIYTGDGETLEYAPEFKGIMLNLSGLDYWEQKYQRFSIDREGKFIYFEGGPIFLQLPGFGLEKNKNEMLKTQLQNNATENPGTRQYDNYIGGEHNHINTAGFNVNEGYTQMLSVDNKRNVDVSYPVQEKYRNNKVRFVIMAKGGRKVHSDSEIPNTNTSSQFHIGGASMINEALDKNDINWTQPIHNGYSYYNLNPDSARVYIVELDPYDPELQDHIYLMFNNDVYVYWMAITNEPRNILSDFDGVTYSYPKDIDMSKTNLTLGMQTKEGIYTKADAGGNYKLASEGEYTIKNVYQVGSAEAGKGTRVQLKAYTVNQFNPSSQSVTLTEIRGNIPKNEGVMLYTEPRMSTLANNPIGLEAATYNRGTTVYSVPYTERIKNKDGEWVWVTKYNWYTATEGYNNVHNYYYLPLYFIAQAENMSAENYAKTVPESTYGGLQASEIPVISDNHVVTPNLLRPTTFGQVLSMDSRVEDQPISVINDNEVIHFGYNNEFICRNLYYVGEDQTKVMDIPYITRPNGAYEDLYYYEIGIEFARFYRINSPDLNHHNRSAYMTLTWDEYKVNTEGKPLSITTQGSNQVPKFVRFSSTSNPIDIKFDGANDENLVSEDGGFPDGINEIEQSTGDVKAYNLNGIRVNGLSKGVYIINGKKVVVK